VNDNTSQETDKPAHTTEPAQTTKPDVPLQSEDASQNSETRSAHHDQTPASDETPVNDEIPASGQKPASDETSASDVTTQEAREPAQSAIPKPVPTEPNRRDFSECLTVAKIHELRGELLGIEHDIARQSSQPAWFSPRAMEYLKDAYEAAALRLPNYRGADGLRADDLRIINKEYSDSMIDSLELAFKHLQGVMSSYVYDQGWINILNVVFDAAKAIADEVRDVEAEVAKQVAKLGPIQEAASLDATSLDGIFERRIFEKL
jgi:hypothetical protein